MEKEDYLKESEKHLTRMVIKKITELAPANQNEVTLENGKQISLGVDDDLTIKKFATY